MSNSNNKKCIAHTGQWCDCQECQDNEKAWDAIEDKPMGVTAIDALIKAGFSNAKAKEQIAIFDELGVFNADELS